MKTFKEFINEKDGSYSGGLCDPKEFNIGDRVYAHFCMDRNSTSIELNPHIEPMFYKTGTIIEIGKKSRGGYYLVQFDDEINFYSYGKGFSLDGEERNSYWLYSTDLDYVKDKPESSNFEEWNEE